MIAMDLDGTLLGEDKKISQENREALLACRDRGIHLVLASGRSFEAIRMFAVGMGTDCGIISCNGARMDASVDGPVILEDCIPEDIAREVFGLLIDGNVYFEAYTPGRIYMTDGFKERFHSHAAQVVDLAGRRLEYVDGTEIMKKEALGCVYKFVVFSPDQSILAETADRMRRYGKVDVTSSWTDNIELIRKGAGKGRALLEFARSRGIRPEEIMSFGDQINDLDMLSVSGWPVAMKNAVEELKNHARLIAPHHNCSGVGKTIRKYVLDEGNAL